MSNVYTTSPEKAYPPAADSIAITPSGSDWGNSAWVEIAAATTETWYLGHLAVKIGIDALYEIEIGTGPSGGEVVKATLCGRSSDASFTGFGTLTFDVPYGPIPAGTRIAARLRKQGTDTTAWGISVGYYSALEGNASSSLIAPRVWPSAADGVSVTPNATPWANSSWVEVIASTSGILTIGQIVAKAVSSAFWELDVGLGGAGVEVVQTTIAGTPHEDDLFQKGPQVTPLRPMLSGLPAASRIAIRLRTSSTGVTPWQIKLVGYVAFDRPELTTEQPQAVWPSADDHLAVTAGNGVWLNGAWVEFDPALASNIAITGVSAGNGNGYEGELDVGIGSAGNEVPVTTFRFDSGLEGEGVVPLLYARNISAGQRIALRLRSEQPLAQVPIKLTAVVAPDFDQVTNESQDVWPPAISSYAVFDGATDFANGSWVEFESSAPEDVVITGIAVSRAEPSEAEVDIGFGSSGSEVVASTYRLYGEGNVTSHAAYRPLPVPLLVLSGTRVSMRVRRNGSSGQPWDFALTHTPAIRSTVEQLTIEGIEKDIRFTTLQINKVASGVHTFAAEVMSDDGTDRPAVDQEILFHEGDTLLFGGLIQSTTEMALGAIGDVPITTRISASDFSILADRRYVNGSFSASSPGESVRSGLQTLVDDYLSPYGVTLDPAQDEGPTLAAATYVYRKLTDVLNDWSKQTGRPWKIDYLKQLSMFAPADRPAPFDIVDTADSAIGDLELETTKRDGFANRVIVIAPPRTVSQYVETWTGDGSTTSFALTVTTTEAQTRGLVTNDGIEQTLSNPGEGGTWELDVSVTPNILTKVSGPPPALGAVITLVVVSGTYTAIAIAPVGSPQPARPEEIVITLPGDVILTQAEMQAIADNELAIRNQFVKHTRYDVHDAGLEPGQIQTIQHAPRNLNAQFIIQEVDIHDIVPSADDLDQPAILQRSISALSRSDDKGNWRNQWTEGGTGSGGSISGSADTPLGSTSPQSAFGVVLPSGTGLLPVAAETTNDTLHLTSDDGSIEFSTDPPTDTLDLGVRPESFVLRGTRSGQPSASSVKVGTLYSVTDEGDALERSNGSTWDSYAGSTGGSVTHSGSLTADQLIIGNGGDDIEALGSAGTTTQVLHGNAAGAPSFSAVDLANDVTGNLAVSHLNSGTSASSSTFWRGDGTWAAASGGGGYNYSGSGHPQGTQSGTPGQTYLDTSTGYLYVKSPGSGSSTSGWYLMAGNLVGSLASFMPRAFAMYITAPSASSGFFFNSTDTVFSNSGGTYTNVQAADGFYKNMANTDTSSNGWYHSIVNAVLCYDNDFDVVYHIKTDPSLLTNTVYWAGFTSAGFPSGNTPSANAILFRYSAGTDSGWVGVTDSGGSTSVTGTVASIAAGTAYRLRIRKTGSTVYFSVNDSAEVSTSSNVPSGTTEPTYSIIVIAVSSGTRNLKFRGLAGWVGGN